MTAVALLVLAALLACAVLRLRRVDRGLDWHIREALALVNGDPVCERDCDCGGLLRDASGVVHGPTMCAPLRETMLDGRWGTP